MPALKSLFCYSLHDPEKTTHLSHLQTGSVTPTSWYTFSEMCKIHRTIPSKYSNKLIFILTHDFDLNAF